MQPAVVYAVLSEENVRGDAIAAIGITDQEVYCLSDAYGII
jgi:hypothetical protein